MPWCEALLLSLLSLLVMQTAARTITPDWISRFCNCNNRHPQTVFCESDFVVLAEVLSAVRNSGQRLRYSPQTFADFRIEIHKVFKGGHLFGMGFGSSRRFRTRLFYVTTIACSIDIPVTRQKYVFTGNMLEGKPVVSKCSWMKFWDNVTPRQRKGLKKLYKRHCQDCPIKYCTDSSCPAEPFMCNLNIGTPDINKCYHRQTFCRKRPNPHSYRGYYCVWARSNDRLERCITRNRICLRQPRLCPEWHRRSHRG